MIFKKIFNLINSHKFITIIFCLILLVIIFICLIPIIFVGDCSDRVSSGIVPTTEDISNLNTKYERVVIFGVDGAGAYFKDCDTPNFDKIFSSGSITYEGISQYKTNSAENWTSMLHGVTFQKHHITNTIAENNSYTDLLYPSIFKVYAENNSNVTFSSIVNWSPINTGMIEDNIPGMTRINVEDIAGLNKKDKDYSLKLDKAVSDEVIKRINTCDDKILFIQFDAVDHYGHKNGYGSKKFVKALQNIDDYLGEIYQTYIDLNRSNDTLFILASDHGHRLLGDHGRESKYEKLVTIAVNGGFGNIINGAPGKVVTHDIASIVLYALGIEQPVSYESKVPYNMFNTLEIK